MEVFKIKSHESVYCDCYFMYQEMLNASTWQLCCFGLMKRLWLPGQAHFYAEGLFLKFNHLLQRIVICAFCDYQNEHDKSVHI